MHFEGIDEAIAAGDPDLLTPAPDVACVKGCYRCLLSYYNQPDHEHIDRTDETAKRLLVALGASSVEISSKPKSSAAARAAGMGGTSGTSGESHIEAMLAAAGIPLPDEAKMDLGGLRMPYVWRSHRVAASCQPLTEEARSAADKKGFDLFQFPGEPTGMLPADFLKQFG
jgi:hypothetical protein